jgi:hypothetical protein
MVVFGCVVEGDGETHALPVLLRRLIAEIAPGLELRIDKPVRLPRSRLLKPGELERAIELTVRRIGHDGAVLVVLDADDDCPAELGPRLQARATAARSDVAIGVVVAKCEFEAWFLAAAESLRGVSGLAVSLQAPSDPEAVRGAKEWLSDRMGGTARYSPTRHQAAFAAQFDLELARRADSFDKCWREVTRLVALAQAGA